MHRNTAGFWRRYLPLLALGLIGIVVVGVDALRIAEALPIETPPPRSRWIPMIAASLLQPILALFLSAAFGAMLAHRFGLVSVIATGSGRDVFKSSLLISFGAGILAGGAVVALDRLLFSELIPQFFTGPRQLMRSPVDLLLIGVFYGGITEEIMMRWGLMTSLVFLSSWLRGWIGTRQNTVFGPQPARVFWSSICLAAFVFALVHLPTAAAVASLTEIVVARVLLLNAIAGVIFGWLFWRYTLESAMVAHAALHVVFFAAAIGGTGP
jgi:membrane protease YdiL (CAAX protease family)